MNATHITNNMPFIYLNLNPFNKDTDDCTIRAISLFLNQSWDKTYLDICEMGFFIKEMPSTNHTWRKYLINKGCIRERISNFYPYEYTVKDFCYDHPYGRYLIKVDEHVLTVINGIYYDTWDSGNEIIHYYWRKE